ncbi:hypothetical protein [Tepidibacter hydrothermalis]|uniref:Uncharacterized protein n=1 Tax=Tepidibacter hydrothermalis TaxID=3036126 RepID=A0ABY8E7E2_9FIRM|nr:hypothetical protein [Tepidibacter hydrothermalis]WFD08769.1 hypothetical protein P4S50_10200 [Tepidibacter hydrothermalis]
MSNATKKEKKSKEKWKFILVGCAIAYFAMLFNPQATSWYFKQPIRPFVIGSGYVIGSAFYEGKYNRDRLSAKWNSLKSMLFFFKIILIFLIIQQIILIFTGYNTFPIFFPETTL